jgi:Holliday junction resolvasome RuvABC endonuclease subunit
MKILALDLSTHKTGFAVFIEGALKGYGLMEAEGENYHERILCVREDIIKKIKEFKIEYIILEEVPMNEHNNLKVAHDLCVCQGMIVGLCAQFNLGLRVYFPNSWRSIVGTYNGTKEGKKRDFQKEKAVEITNSLYNLNFKYYKTDSKKKNEYSDDDICEAILLGLAFLKEGV